MRGLAVVNAAERFLARVEPAIEGKKKARKEKREEMARLKRKKTSKPVRAWEREAAADRLFDEVELFEFLTEPSWDEYNYYGYDYDGPEYDDDWRQDHHARWGESEREWHAPLDTTKVRDCAVCCEEMLDELTDDKAFLPVAAGLSFKDALLVPRAPAVRDVSQLPRRAAFGGERGCCVQCVVQTIATTFERTPATLTVACPRCRHAVGLATCRAFLASGQVAVDVAAPLLAHIDALTVRQAVLAGEAGSSSFVQCVGPNCKAEFLFAWTASSCSLVVCAECSFANCVVCKCAYHFGRTCFETLAEKPSLSWRHENTKACPSCFTAIEKNGGCSHVHCARCNADFDWNRATKGIFGMETMTRALSSVPKPSKKNRRGKKPAGCARPKPVDVDAIMLPIFMRTIRI